MQDTFAFAAQAVNHALGVQVIYTGPLFGPRTVDAVLGSEFDAVQSGDVKVSSRKLEIELATADFDTTDVRVESWAGGTVEFLEGPLKGEVLEAVKARPGAEGVSVVLVLKRTEA